jgi:UDP-glucose 4-epimerase
MKKMKTTMKDRNILVTGGAGFIASHLVDSLIEEGANVTVIDDLSNGKMENVNKKAKFTLGSIRDSETVMECLCDVDLVFHLAANTGTKETSMGFNDPFEEMKVNAEGTEIGRAHV